MGVGYQIVNFSRRELISFAHIPASKKRELAGNPVSSAISTWYFLECAGDQLAFVSDTYGEWPFPSGSDADLNGYKDVTGDVIDSLIADGILEDLGRETFWDDEPDCYIRVLRNIWMGPGDAA